MIRKSTLFFAFIVGAMVCLSLLVRIYPRSQAFARQEILAEEKRLVRELGITDLCLFSEARYTRHLSQADLYSAFQDHPAALEHFPSGSLVLPPIKLWMKPQGILHEVD